MGTYRSLGVLFFMSTALTGCVGEDTPQHIETDPLVLGDYQLQISENQLRVNHLAEPDHDLWVSIATGKLLSASQTALEIKDARSSYTIRENTAATCEVAEIQEYTQSPTGLVFAIPILFSVVIGNGFVTVS